MTNAEVDYQLDVPGINKCWVTEKFDKRLFDTSKLDSGYTAIQDGE